jgi:hypothetical protein
MLGRVGGERTGQRRAVHGLTTFVDSAARPRGEPYPADYAQQTLVSRAGLEPATTALKVRCSTN